MTSNCVLIGDIKKSRAIDDWATLFRKLEETLNAINAKFPDDIRIDFKPTVGDEFQGVLKSPKNAYEIYVFIKSNMPVDFYCGMGIGDIERPLADELGMRGTAFYRARSALELCKKSNRKLLIKSSDMTNQTDEILNTLLRFIEVLEESWTERQREVVNYLRSHPGSTYEQIGNHFGISKQAVSQILAAADWAAISEGENLLHHLLGSINSVPGQV
ncbi:MAG: hypothetical protein EFT35_01605 [Methanophagales archaeon ANME-1-THS]|nr:MAG: hypothetical protein EFT35_01605 [Methanophagales archaeon ANME-1-THS]